MSEQERGVPQNAQEPASAASFHIPAPQPSQLEHGADGRFRLAGWRTILARAILSVLKNPNGVETLDWQIADAVLATLPRLSDETGEALAKCEYCGDGKHTGLPGGACENCMNTGYKYPNKAELALAAIELAKLPGDVYWLLAKGRTRPDEPLWAIQITDHDANKIVETEGSHPADCVSAALALIQTESKA